MTSSWEIGQHALVRSIPAVSLGPLYSVSDDGDDENVIILSKVAYFCKTTRGDINDNNVFRADIK